MTGHRLLFGIISAVIASSIKQGNIAKEELNLIMSKGNIEILHISLRSNNTEQTCNVVT